MSKTNKRSENEGQTRREALGTVAAGATGALIFPHLAEGQNWSAAQVPKMLRLNCDQWSEFIGKTFQAQSDDAHATLKLEEVVADKTGSRPSHLRQESVSLVFSASQAITDANYLLQNPELGSAPVFLHATKRGPQANHTRYQVVIN